MILDPYCKNKETSTYSVQTLYLDTYNFEFYFDKIDGMREKIKLRIRTYDPIIRREKSRIFVEIKERHHNVIIKNRVLLSYPAFERYFEYDTLEHIIKKCSPDELKVLEKFLYWKTIKALKPSVLIRYQREAYFGEADERLRITFDRELECKPSSGIDFESDDSEWIAIATKGIIMEIKFSGFIPYWLRRIIQNFNLQAEPICKYALGLVTIGEEDRSIFSKIYY